MLLLIRAGYLGNSGRMFNGMQLGYINTNSPQVYVRLVSSLRTATARDQSAHQKSTLMLWETTRRVARWNVDSVLFVPGLSVRLASSVQLSTSQC